MKRDFDGVMERDANRYFVGSGPSCRGCHAHATSLDAPMDRMREASALWLEENSQSRQLEFVGVQRVRLQPPARAAIADFLAIAVIDLPDTVHDGFTQLVNATGADAFMPVSDVSDLALRQRPIGIAAEFGRG